MLFQITIPNSKILGTNRLTSQNKANKEKSLHRIELFSPAINYL